MKRFSVVLLTFLTVPAFAAEREVDLLADDGDASFVLIEDAEQPLSADLGLPDIRSIDLESDDDFQFETATAVETDHTDADADVDLLADDAEVDLLADE